MTSHPPQLHQTATARRALLETISEREKELSRIRHAAEKIVEEEQLASTQHLQNLKTDLLQYQRLLQDKDDLVQTLYTQIDDMKQDYIDHQKEVIDRSNEEVERKIDRIKSQLEKEHSDALRKHEICERKRLQVEFEDKLMSCEKRLHNEYQASLLVELQKQEELLWSNFNKINSDKQSRYDEREKELCEILREREKDIAELSIHYEKNLHMSQSKLFSELQTEIEGFARENDEYKRKNKKLLDEKEEAIEKYRCVEQEVFDVERENSQLKDKVHDLLEVIRGAEKNYVEKVEVYEQEKSEQMYQLKSMSKNIVTLNTTVKKLKSSHHDEIKVLKKKRSQEKKALLDTIKELRDSLEEIEGEKRKGQELTQRSALRKDEEIKSLMEELDNCRQKVKRNQEIMTQNEKQEYLLKQELEKKCENAFRQEADAKECKALLRMEKTKFDEELRSIVIDKDLAKQDKEKCATEVCRLKKELDEVKFQNDLTITTLKEEKSTIYKENRTLKLNLDEAGNEINRLKDNISKMRKEMEALVAAPESSPSQSKKEEMHQDIILSDMHSISERLAKLSKKDHNYDWPEMKNAINKICASLGYLHEIKAK